MPRMLTIGWGVWCLPMIGIATRVASEEEATAANHSAQNVSEQASGQFTEQRSSLGGRCEKHKVIFKLVSMHSYFTIPTCSRLPSMSRWYDGVKPDLSECGSCATDFARSEIHWNIPGCTTNLCVKSAGSLGVDGETIGPADGLEIHPTCAWGIVDEMKEVYQHPYRAASVGGVMYGLGADGLNPVNWAKFLMSLKGGFVNVANQAAHMVDWNRRLNPNCNGARSKDSVLVKPNITLEHDKDNVLQEVPHPVGAVCWNNVMDFRDLWCHYNHVLDVTDPVACQKQFYPDKLWYADPNMHVDITQSFSGQAHFTTDSGKYKCCCSEDGDIADVTCKVARLFFWSGCGQVLGGQFHSHVGIAEKYSGFSKFPHAGKCWIPVSEVGNLPRNIRAVYNWD